MAFNFQVKSLKQQPHTIKLYFTVYMIYWLFPSQFRVTAVMYVLMWLGGVIVKASD